MAATSKWKAAKLTSCHPGGNLAEARERTKRASELKAAVSANDPNRALVAAMIFGVVAVF